ncbi:MAG TPA: 50S ribosomal protein L17 [Candidatus Acidoferrum sp.]|nr:50S ribosomal protein L17 [Candidatus Acidoferrum sp.]
MGHQDKVAKLNRTRSHREAMLANMAMSLFEHRLIKTTDARAKALRPVVDRLITTAKKNTLASKREVARTVRVKDIFKKLYTEIMPQFAERQSGFTRVIKLGVRRGDGAIMSVVELMTEKPAEAEGKDKKGKKKTAKSKPGKASASSKKAKPVKKAAAKE